MSKNKKQLVPARRFKEFENADDWVLRKLDNEVSFFSGLTYSPKDVSNSGTLVLRSSNVKKGNIALKDNVYVNKNVVNSDNVQKNDIIVVVRNGSRNLIGKHAKISKPMNDTVIGAFMTGVRANNSDFINTLLDTKLFKKEIQKNLGATINQITVGNFKKMSFNFPTDYEQKSIGSLFKNLDELITLQQHKLDKLKRVKAAYLTEMFPAEGEREPKRRFPGFTGAWEERKLNQIAMVLDGDRGKNYPSESDLSGWGHTVFMSATNVTKNGFNFDTRQYITEEKTNALGNGKLQLDDIVVTSRGTLGNIAHYSSIVHNQIPFARINSGMLILRSHDEFSPEYITQYLKSPLGKKQIDLISFGSAQPQLTKKDVNKYKIELPSYEEQVQVGSFFESMDNLIALHQRKLDKLKKMKAAYLNEMFV